MVKLGNSRKGGKITSVVLRSDFVLDDYLLVIASICWLSLRRSEIERKRMAGKIQRTMFL